MKHKGIEVGIPSITQITECIDSKGYNTSCSKLFDFCSASKWKIISERHIESVEQLVEKFGRKKGFGLKRKKKGEEHKNIKAQNKQAKYPEVKLPSKQTIANRFGHPCQPITNNFAMQDGMLFVVWCLPARVKGVPNAVHVKT